MAFATMTPKRTLEQPPSASNSPSEEQSPQFPSAFGEVRRRVVKACQRCRLKKCKCDGLSPCTRCKADDEICYYGKQKKSDKRNFEMGFVQGLEQQNSQLRHGIVEIYGIMQKGRRLEPVESNDAGQPLIHKLLERLGVLNPDDSSEGMSYDTAWSDSCQPADNRSFRPLPESPPITPSFQSSPFGSFNQFPGTGYTPGPPVQNNQATAGAPFINDIIRFGPTAQSTSGLMLSMPSPSSSLGVLGGDDSMSLFNSYGPMQWSGYNPQEEFYDFPGGSGVP